MDVAVVVADPGLSRLVLDCVGRLSARVVLQKTAAGEASLFTDQLKRLVPDILFVDLAGIQEPFPELMRRLGSLPSAPAVFAVHGSADSEIILSALRSGVTEFFSPPINESTLSEAFERVAAKRVQRVSRPRAKTMGFLSAKGGCGATTISCHVASEIARVTGCDTLLADFDVEAGMVGFWTKAGGQYSILDAVGNTERLDLSLWKGLVSPTEPHLDVLKAPSFVYTGGFSEAAKFHEALRFAQLHYDWVIADLGRGRSALSFSLLAAIDALFIVTTPSLPALYHVKTIVQSLTDVRYERERVKIALNGESRKQRLSADEISKVLGMPVDLVLPTDSSEMNDALEAGTLVSRTSDLGKRFNQFARKIAGIHEPDTPRSSSFGLKFFRTQES